MKATLEVARCRANQDHTRLRPWIALSIVITLRAYLSHTTHEQICGQLVCLSWHAIYLTSLGQLLKNIIWLSPYPRRRVYYLLKDQHDLNYGPEVQIKQTMNSMELHQKVRAYKHWPCNASIAHHKITRAWKNLVQDCLQNNHCMTRQCKRRETNVCRTWQIIASFREVGRFHTSYCL